MVDNDKYGTLFCKINGFSPRSIGAPTPTPSSLTPINSPLQNNPVGVTASLLYLSTVRIFVDQTSGEYIAVILFYLPPGIMPLAAAKLTYRTRLLYYLKTASTAILEIPRPHPNAYPSLQNQYPIGLPPIHILFKVGSK